MTKHSYSVKASVIMPVFNRQRYLKESMESVLNQSFTDFEFIIIDDASTDDSLQIIYSFHDSRIVLLKNKTNIGISASRNLGLKIAKGEYIIVFDSDDVNVPRRFELQIRFMDDNPQIGVCGSWYETFGTEKRVFLLPKNSDFLKAQLLFGSSLCHPSVILRRELMNSCQIMYNEEFNSSIDYELWAQLLDKAVFTNMQHVLLKYRVHKKQVSDVIKHDQLSNASKIRAELLSKMGISATIEEMQTHENICSYTIGKCTDNVFTWLNRLVQINSSNSIFDKSAFIEQVCDIGLIVCAVSENKLHAAKLFLFKLSVPLRVKFKAVGNRLLKTLKYQYFRLNPRALYPR